MNFSRAIVVFARNPGTGEVTQLADKAGCLGYSGGQDCGPTRGVDVPTSLAVSPDGTNVYVASAGSSRAIAVFARAKATGELTQLAGTAGCVKHTQAFPKTDPGSCAAGKGLDYPASLAVSPDGRNVYVISSPSSDAIAVFARAKVAPRGTAVGTLTQLAVTTSTALDNPTAIAVSPDGKNVYVTSADGGSFGAPNTEPGRIAVFARDPGTGKLTQLAGTAGCITETGSGGACTNGKALESPTSLVVSPDGKNVYVASKNSSAIALFARSTTGGKLTQLAGVAGCISQTGSGGTCVNGRALGFASSLAVSADGKSLYVASRTSGAVAVFARYPVTGKLQQLPGVLGCVSETGSSCADGKGLGNATFVAAAGDGTSVYVASPVGGGHDGGVAIFARHG